MSDTLFEALVGAFARFVVIVALGSLIAAFGVFDWKLPFYFASGVAAGYVISAYVRDARESRRKAHRQSLSWG